ncbi:MAG: amidohydrolase [Rhodothalassiaceae bacterium]
MNRSRHLAGLWSCAALLVTACAPSQAPVKTASGAPAAEQAGSTSSASASAFPSTYQPLPSDPTLIRNATVLDGLGGRIDGGDVLMVAGEIAAVGEDLDAPAGAQVIDGRGKWVTPGIIDVHSHLGVYPSPGVPAHADGNELTNPNTAEVWAEHSIWPQDPGFSRALAGGVTSLQILPGSGNLFGGRSVVVKNVPARTVQAMKFPGAPYGLKMACGENPKRVYGSRGRTPGSRMANFAGYRAAWIEAADYRDKLAAYEAGETDDPPKRNLELETLAGVLNDEIILHMHCYRGDEMVQVLDLADEFSFEVGTFHHAVESYKIADYLAEKGVCSAMWADWWGFKMEAYDSIRENVPWVHLAGACAIVHSDSDSGIQRLNQEAAKALGDARKAGADISKAEAWTWLAHNAAKSLGIEDQTGTLEAGKDADVVVWTGDPFSVYTKAEKVFVDGALVYDLTDPDRQPVSDFELGQPGEGDLK